MGYIWLVKKGSKVIRLFFSKNYDAIGCPWYHFYYYNPTHLWITAQHYLVKTIQTIPLGKYHAAILTPSWILISYDVGTTIHKVFKYWKGKVIKSPKNEGYLPRGLKRCNAFIE